MREKSHTDQVNNTRPDLDTLEKAHRAAGKVKRWHTEEVFREQKISDHVYGLMRIYYHIWGVPDGHTFLDLLFHDFEELFLGDLPHWTHKFPKLRKAYDEAWKENQKVFPKLPSVTDKTYRIAAVDHIDALEFMLDEVWYGNEALKGPMTRLYSKLEKSMDTTMLKEEASRVEHYLNEVGFTHRYNLVIDGVHRGG